MRFALPYAAWPPRPISLEIETPLEARHQFLPADFETICQIWQFLILLVFAHFFVLFCISNLASTYCRLIPNVSNKPRAIPSIFAHFCPISTYFTNFNLSSTNLNRFTCSLAFSRAVDPRLAHTTNDAHSRRFSRPRLYKTAHFGCFRPF